MPKIQNNGAEFFYELHGQGPAVVLIAGYGCDHSMWQFILGRLSQQFQVLIFDNRSIGQTKDDFRPLSADLCADDVMALVKTLKLKKPHIVGHSMGGSIAQSIGSRYSSQIDKLVILNSSAKWRLATLKGLHTTWVLSKAQVELDLIVNQIQSWSFGEAFLKNESTSALIKNMMLANPYPQSIAEQERQFQILHEFDGRKGLARIEAPTLVVSGKQDLLSLSYESQWIASQIAQARHVELDSGHGSFLEVPAELTQLLIDFLAQS